MMTQILTVLAALAVPATIIAVVDDWFLRPRRRIVGRGKPDAPLLAANYYLLPLLLIAALLRLLVSERLDFSLVLVSVVVITTTPKKKPERGPLGKEVELAER